jgi:hypothetical protein
MTTSGSDGNPAMDRARELFFQYDGSGFYMSRDDVEWEYRGYGVPPELEAQWRHELTAEKIAKLDQPGNWWTLNYLCHHNDTRFLHQVVRAEPLGKLWERVSYLELMLEYAERCAAFYPRDDIRTAIQTVMSRTAALDIDSVPEELPGREEQLRGRERQLIETADLILFQNRLIRHRSSRPGWLAKLFAVLRRSKGAGAKD